MRTEPSSEAEALGATVFSLTMVPLPGDPPDE